MASVSIFLLKTFVVLMLLIVPFRVCLAQTSPAPQPAIADQSNAGQSVGSQAPAVAPPNQAPIFQAPTAQPPVADQPGANQNMGQAPAAQPPVANQPDVNQNVGQAPVAQPNQPIFQAPTSQPPANDNSDANQNVNQGQAPAAQPPAADQNMGQGHGQNQAPAAQPPSQAPSIFQAPAAQPPVSDQPVGGQSVNQPPVAPPSQAPAAAPAQAPSVNLPPPTSNLPQRTLVAVQGVVYCKPCKYQGVNTLLGATPLSGATVRLMCNNSRRPFTQDAQTDQNGFFFIHAQNQVTNYGAHKCKVFLSNSPSNTCNRHTDLSSGHSGALLRRLNPPTSTTPYTLYTVGPFAFEPTSCSP